MAYRSSAEFVGIRNATTASVNKPTGTANGDIILLMAAGIVGGTLSATGFTQIGTQLSYASSNAYAALWYRVADGSEGSTFTVTSTVTEEDFCLICGSWSGRSSTITAVTTVQSTLVAVAAMNLTGYTAATGDDIAILATTYDSGGTSGPFTPVTGYTEDVDDGSTVRICHTLNHKDNVSSGATGTLVLTPTGSGNFGWGAFVVKLPIASASDVLLGQACL